MAHPVIRSGLAAVVLVAAVVLGGIVWWTSAGVLIALAVVGIARTFRPTNPPPAGPGASAPGEAGYTGRVAVGDEGGAAD